MSAEVAASGFGNADLKGQDSDTSTLLLRQIVDQSPVVTVVVAAPGFRIVYANVAAYGAAGSAAGELLGRSAAAFAFVDPLLLLTKTPTRVRAVVDGESGERIWWDVSYIALNAAAPEASSVLITAVDVTHYEIARAKAEAAQDTLDALLEYLPEGISIVCESELQVRRARASEQAEVCEIYRPGSDAPLSPADIPLARAASTGEVTLNETLLVRRRDGDVLTVMCNSGPIRDAEGQATGAVMAWRDVGELQRAQAAVRDSQERLHAVLLQIPAAIFIVEPPDGRATFKSRQVDEVLGELDADMAKAKAARRGWAVHEDGSPYELTDYPSRRALFSGETVRAEPMAFVRSDGRRVDLEVHAGPIHGKTGEIIAAVGVAMDVTERRLAEARQAFLFRLQDSLRALSEPAEILNAAATLLGRHLGAARIGYSEMLPDDETLLITNGYVDGAPPVNGLFRLAAFGAHHEQEMRQGRTLVYADVQADDQGARAFGFELGTRAHVSAPLVRDGRFVGSLYVTHFKPYNWTPADISLIEDVAARIWDAAERGRAESRLRESEERLRLALESSGLGFWEYDAITKKTVRSARHDAIFGYATPVTDWTYEQFKDHIPESDQKVVTAGFRAALEQGEDWYVECRMIRVDGSRGWLKVRARPHFGSDGKVIRLLGTVVDITERKRGEETAIQTATKFETFAQMIPSMVWTSLPDGQIDWFNARVCEYSGIPEAEMKPNGWAPVHPDDIEGAVRTWREALASGEPFETEYRIRRHDGEFRWHITRAVPIRGADGAIALWIGTSADIQDQKSSEQA
jgi:PAS domain S-box-containing protein